MPDMGANMVDVERLKQLMLLDDGTLTQEEFDAEKAALLAGGSDAVDEEDVADASRHVWNVTTSMIALRRCSYRRIPSAAAVLNSFGVSWHVLLWVLNLTRFPGASGALGTTSERHLKAAAVMTWVRSCISSRGSRCSIPVADS